jgi:DNA mismatch repair protein MutS2
MNDSSGIDRIELGAIKDALLGRVRTPLGATEVRALAPLPTRAEARTRIDALSEARSLLERGEEPAFGGATDVRAAIDLGAKGVTLDSAQLRAIAETMRGSSALRRYLLAREDDGPLLYGMGASMEDLSRTAEEVQKSFDPDGTLADSASPELGPLRKRLRGFHEMIREKLEQLLQASQIKPYLQEPYFTVRGDRYVLPIRASFQNEVAGIVHDASGSGQTVFVEPQAVVELGNRVKIAQSAVIEEEHRILTELTELVVSERDGLLVNLEALGRVDLVFAGGRLSRDLGAEAILPEEQPGFDLIEARHPLLVLQRIGKADAGLVVGNDLGLKPEQRVLILTGPNTGGKTVAMKTIGLFAMMARCGLHLPCAARSRIGWFDRIEAAIGDDQSIASNLSTFAAHLVQIMNVLDRAGAETLVLLDEIAADTDPTQGQALAQAVLEALADRGAHVVVTTHFERLKAVPFADPRFRNAGVGFDPERLRPTYKVTLDLPQSSSGIDIAQSLGLGRSIVERARALSGEGTGALEGLMTGLRDKQIELDRVRFDLEEERRKMIVAQRELERTQRSLEEERRKVIDRERVDFLRELDRSRNEVKATIARLQKAASSEEVRDAMRLASEASAKLAQTEAEERAKVEPAELQLEPGKRVENPSVGDWVHVDKLGKDGEIVAIEGKEALVAVGNMRTRVPVSGLTHAQSKRPKGLLHESRSLKKALEEAKEKQRSAEVPPTEEVDLRGNTVDEALARIDAFLDVHYSGPASKVKIIHGHGSGALRQAIREHLKRSGYVRNFRPGEDNEGGDGITVVELA